MVNDRISPGYCLGFKIRLSDWDPVRGLHQGQRSHIPRKQAGQITATCDDQQQLKSTLAKNGAVPK
jgi:hypothetical protein